MNSSSINKDGIDIICFSLSRGDAPINSPALSLAKELAKTNRVFYIEHPYSWKDYLKERNTLSVREKKKAILRGKDIYYRKHDFPEKLVAVTPKLVYPVNFLPPGKLYNRVAAINNRIMLQTLRAVITGNRITDYIFINFFDPYFLRKIPLPVAPKRFIYQCMDDLSQVPYTNRHGTGLEEDIIKNADHVLCTSRELVRLASRHSGHVHYFPNGADTGLFGSAGIIERPADLPADNRKIIGFTGSIEYRTDFELLKKTALFHHDKILVLVGPVIGEEHIDLGIDKIPNIIFLGPKEISSLPSYLAYFDCAIIPYKKNKLTASIYPLKINEYLAAGKPVVSTDFSEDIRMFGTVAYIEPDHEAFIKAIDRAVSEDDAEKKRKRVEFAASNSWTRRAADFWDMIS